MWKTFFLANKNNILIRYCYTVKAIFDYYWYLRFKAVVTEHEYDICLKKRGG